MTNFDNRIAEACSLSRARPVKQRRFREGFRWVPMITQSVWMSASNFIVRKLWRKIEPIVEGGNTGLLAGEIVFLHSFRLATGHEKGRTSVATQRGDGRTGCFGAQGSIAS